MVAEAVIAIYTAAVAPFLATCMGSGGSKGGFFAVQRGIIAVGTGAIFIEPPGPSFGYSVAAALAFPDIVID